MESFNALAAQLILAISSYQKMQTALLNVIIDTHHGRVNPLLLTPRQLRHQLATIREHMPATVQLPATQDNLLTLYNLMTVESHITEQLVVFRIKLPLSSMETFELLQVTAVPVKINNNFISILPATKYLAINLNRDLYYPLTQEEVEKCTELENNTHLCEQHHPLYRKGSSIGACEISILTETTIPRTCTLINLVEPTPWIPLHQPNCWIYVTNSTTTINILCGHKVIQHKLQGSGTLELTSGCIIRDGTSIIQAHNLYHSSTSTSFITSTNFTKLLDASVLPQMQNNSILEKSFSQNITELKQKIEVLKDHEYLLKKAQIYNIHHFSLGYLILAVIIIITIYVIQYQCQAKKKENKQRKQPTPTPKQDDNKTFEFTSEII